MVHRIQLLSAFNCSTLKIMPNKSFFTSVLIAAALILTGCATPQRPVSLSENTLPSKTQRVGVAMTPLPKVDMRLPGASCLLCIAAATLANSSLIDYTRTLPHEDLPKLKESLAELLRKKGSNVIVISEDLDISKLPDYSGKDTDIAEKDFSPLKQKYDIDKVVLIQITDLGMLRPYSTYFPTSEPKAILKGVGSMVSLNNNAYEWYMPVELAKGSDGPWDESPNFPGLTNAYFQVLEMGKDAFLKPFNN